jgi:hypothetical protein
MPGQLRDKSRFGGNHLHIDDPRKLPFSTFNVFVSGHIESGQISESDGICCKYDFVAGTDWAIIEVIF